MAATVSTRRRRTRASATGSVAELKTMVDQLIKENRRLKKQVAKLESAGGSAGRSGPRSNPVTAGLAGIQRKIRRALDDSAVRPARSRRRTSGSVSRRSAAKPATSGRVRRPASPETQRKRLEALAKARAARAAKKAATEAPAES
jgi:hypothetical protein